MYSAAGGLNPELHFRGMLLHLALRQLSVGFPFTSSSVETDFLGLAQKCSCPGRLSDTLTLSRLKPLTDLFERSLHFTRTFRNPLVRSPNLRGTSRREHKLLWEGNRVPVTRSETWSLHLQGGSSAQKLPYRCNIQWSGELQEPRLTFNSGLPSPRFLNLWGQERPS